MIWMLFTVLSWFVFLRNQLYKYLGLSVDWHLVLHIFTLLMFFFVILKFLTSKVRIKKFDFIFLIFVLIFLSSGLLYLKNGFMMTYWGIFEYLYIFLLPYLLSFFNVSQNNLKSIYKILKVFVIISVGIALYQSLEYLLYYKWELINFAIFTRHDINKPDLVRLGLLRSPSLVGSPMEWGSVALLYFLINFFMKKFKVSLIDSLILFSLIITVTRIVYVFLIVVGFIMFIKLSKIHFGKIVTKLKYSSLVLIIFILFFSIILLQFFIKGHQRAEKLDFFAGKGHLRGFAFSVAKNLENKLIGYGPGTFGSYVSFVLDSKYLKELGIYSIHKDIKRIKTIDAFWLQTFIEMGVLGVLLNLILFGYFFKILNNSFDNISKRNVYQLIIGFSFAAIFVPVIYFVIGIGFTTCIPSFVVWSSIISGISLSYFRSLRDENISG